MDVIWNEIRWIAKMYSPFIMCLQTVGHQIMPGQCFRFHYITSMKGWRSLRRKTLVQPSVRFASALPHCTLSIDPLRLMPFRHQHQHTLSPQHTRGLCCLSVVGWLRNLLTHTHSLRAFLSSKQPESMGERLVSIVWRWSYRLGIKCAYLH